MGEACIPGPTDEASATLMVMCTRVSWRWAEIAGSDSAGRGWALRDWISHKLLGDGDAAGPQAPSPVWVARACQHHRREEWVVDGESCHSRKGLKGERAEIWDRGFIWVPFVLRTFGQVGKKWVMLKLTGSTLQEPQSLAPGRVFSVWASQREPGGFSCSPRISGAGGQRVYFAKPIWTQCRKAVRNRGLV